MARERQLKVSIVGDASSAERAFKRTEQAAGRTGPALKTAENALANVSSALTSRLGPAAGVADGALQRMGTTALASGALIKAGIVGGAVVGGVALAKFAASGVRAFVDLASQIRSFQRASGASAEDSSRFVAVLDDLGIEAEAGAAAIFRFGRNVAGGRTDLASYGVQVARSRDGTVSLTETLLNVADAYSKTRDPAKRAELAMAAFGKQGLTLVPLLERGRKGLEEFFAGAERHGQVFSQEDIDRAFEYELALDEFEDSVRSLQLSMGRLLPFITKVTNAIAWSIEQVQTAARGYAAAGKWLVGLLPGVDSGSRKAAKGTDEHKRSAEEVREALIKEQQALVARLQAVQALPSANLAYTKSLDSVRDAQTRLEQAERTAARAPAEAAKMRQDAARAVSDAVRSQADAEQDAARSVEDANRRVEDAERGVADAQEAAKDAQKALTDARKDAARNLEDLREQVDDLALSEEEAILRLEQARADVGKAKSERERKQALLDVARAEDALSDIQRDRGRTVEELAEAEAQGIEGAPNVVAALDQVADANRGIRDAQRELRDAQRGLADAMVNASRSVENAVRAVQNAIEQERIAREQAAALEITAVDGVRKAHQDLQGAVLAVGDAAAAAALGAVVATGMELNEAEKARLAYDARRGALEFLRDTLAPGSPLRNHIEGLLAQYDRFQPKHIDFTINAEQAKAELREIEAILNRNPAINQVVAQQGTIRGALGAERRQHGGPVYPGRSYIVGEKRPELLTLGRSSSPGYITPSVGGGSVTINLTVPGESSDVTLWRVKQAALDAGRQVQRELAAKR